MKKELILTHYTKDPETVCKILCNGFAWVPNKINLINDLVPYHSFEREPQAFGMISFTELSPNKATKVREKYGRYGIIMEGVWHDRNETKKVAYLKPQGIKFSLYKFLFRKCYEDVQSKIRFPEDRFWNMAYTNKTVAGSIAGSKLWVRCLHIYEFLEHSKNKFEKEWRVVNPTPLYGFKETTSEIIANVDPPEGWAKFVNVLSFREQDVRAFICSKSDLKSFREKLPKHYLDKPIITF